MVLRRLLHAMGFRYRLYAKGLPGKPDLVFPKYRAVLFVHGCFWHRHPGCRYSTNPATRPEFWQEKFAGTVERDRRAIKRLTEDGWRVAVVWECALKQRQDAAIVEQVAGWLRGDTPFIEIPETPPEPSR